LFPLLAYPACSGLKSFLVDSCIKMTLILIKLFVAHAIITASTATADVRDLPVTRSGSVLLLGGKPWKAVGPNVYWLGLDENVIPPAGEPFYARTKASYPRRERTTEIMAVVKAIGGTMIRSQYASRFFFAPSPRHSPWRSGRIYG